MKNILLTFLLILEFIVLSAFSYTPIELSFMFWLITVLLFEAWDLVKEDEKKNPSAN